jgi:hypothetical protein
MTPEQMAEIEHLRIELDTARSVAIWLVVNIPARPAIDHACERCTGGSELTEYGYTCPWHRARDWANASV